VRHNGNSSITTERIAGFTAQAFSQKVVKSGVLSTIRRKRWFVSKSELRRVEKKKAIRRIKRRQYTRTGE